MKIEPPFHIIFSEEPDVKKPARQILREVLTGADEVRSLWEADVGTLQSVLEDFSALVGNQVRWALTGGLVLGLHARTWGTEDVEVLLANEEDFAKVVQLTVSKFRRVPAEFDPGAFAPNVLEHLDSGIRVDVLTPEFLGADVQTINDVVATATQEPFGELHVPVVSREGIVVLKLRRSSRQDLADIEAIIRKGGAVDVDNFLVTPAQLQMLRQIEREVLG